jgi:hypothetical protein
MQRLLALLMVLGPASLAFADEEAANRPYVRSDEWGQFYAKSVPAESYGLRGATTVYQVQPGADLPVYAYEWYSPELYLAGFAGTQTVYVIQIGAWPRGREASAQHPAIAFYKNDQLIKAYSTLDIAGEPKNVSPSVSHYSVFGERHGFRRPFGNQLIFEIERHTGELLSYNPDTGLLITPEDEALLYQRYEAEVRIAQLRWDWYQANHKKMSGADRYILTEEELTQMAPGKFPKLPAGHRYVPGSVWEPVRLETD